MSRIRMCCAYKLSAKLDCPAIPEVGQYAFIIRSVFIKAGRRNAS